MNHFHICGLFALLVWASISSTTSAVVFLDGNGQISPADEVYHPAVGRVYAPHGTDSGVTGVCTGFVYDDGHDRDYAKVITAGHCVTDNEIVRFDRQDAMGNWSTSYGISFQMEGFRRNSGPLGEAFDQDLAVVVLPKTGLENVPGLRPVVERPSNETLRVTDLVVVGVAPTAGILYDTPNAPTPINGNPDWVQRGGSSEFLGEVVHGSIEKFSLRAERQAPGNIITSGDSGGPVMLGDAVLGVHSTAIAAPNNTPALGRHFNAIVSTHTDLTFPEHREFVDRDFGPIFIGGASLTSRVTTLKLPADSSTAFASNWSTGSLPTEDDVVVFLGDPLAQRNIVLIHETHPTSPTSVNRTFRGLLNSANLWLWSQANIHGGVVNTGTIEVGKLSDLDLAGACPLTPDIDKGEDTGCLHEGTQINARQFINDGNLLLYSSSFEPFPGERSSSAPTDLPAGRSRVIVDETFENNGFVELLSKGAEGENTIYLGSALLAAQEINNNGEIRLRSHVVERLGPLARTYTRLLAETIRNGENGVIAGWGNILGNLVNAGDMKTGQLLAITGDYSQEPGGVLSLDLTDVDQPPVFTVSGSARLAGSLEVNTMFSGLSNHPDGVRALKVEGQIDATDLDIVTPNNFVGYDVMVVGQSINVLHPGFEPGSGALVSDGTFVSENRSNIDLSGQDLRGIDLSRGNLNNTIFRDADLSASEFRSTNLSGAVISGADFTNADLSEADLRGTLGWSEASVVQANLGGVDLSYTNLSDAEFVGINLASADFSHAILEGANLSGADLSSSRLIGAALDSAILTGTDFRGADLSGADLSGAASLLDALLDGSTSYDQDSVFPFDFSPTEFGLTYVGTMLQGDCNSDTIVDANDLTCVGTIEERDAVLLELNTLPGDFDGNGNIDFVDFLALSGNFGGPGSYAQGNIDLAGDIDFVDFLALSANFGAAPSAESVPEPSITTLWGMAVLCSLFSRRRRS